MCCIQEGLIKSPEYLDIAFKTATILIAFFNAIFAIKIFLVKTKKDDADKERDRKIQLLKTLILDHNLKNFYDLFDKIEIELIKLKQAGLSMDDKSKIEENLSELFISVRRKFYDSLLAVDLTLYEGIKSKIDAFQADLTNAVFDPGVNLSYPPKYDEVINEKLTLTKTDILKKLFIYRG